MSKASIPIEPFRERYLQLVEQGELVTVIATRAGYSRVVADTQRLRRDLGLRPDRTNGHEYYRQNVTDDVALRLCEALRLDPVDVGL